MVASVRQVDDVGVDADAQARPIRQCQHPLLGGKRSIEQEIPGGGRQGRRFEREQRSTSWEPYEYAGIRVGS